jgi:hypothetical protein
MENEVVKFETRTAARGGDPLSFLLNDMAQNEHLRESNELAELIQRRIGSVHPGPSRGVKQAGFRVLVTAFMPAVLVEIGFGTNASEASYMTDPNGWRSCRPRSPTACSSISSGTSAASQRAPVSARPGAWPAVSVDRSALAVQAAGLTFQNPIVLAAGTAAYGTSSTASSISPRWAGS